jgi:hypothetical protein
LESTAEISQKSCTEASDCELVNPGVFRAQAYYVGGRAMLFFPDFQGGRQLWSDLVIFSFLQQVWRSE